MHRNLIETVMGGVVLVVALFFLAFAYTSADLGRVEGYEVIARFPSLPTPMSRSSMRRSSFRRGLLRPCKTQAIQPPPLQASASSRSNTRRLVNAWRRLDRRRVD